MKPSVYRDKWFPRSEYPFLHLADARSEHIYALVGCMAFCRSLSVVIL